MNDQHFIEADAVSQTSQSPIQHAKLPQLELPKFDGNYTQWQPFWDKFNAIVHITDLPTVSKFTYLQSLLKGEALSSICGLALTEANYKAARQLLQQRFGRKERIVHGHIQQLLNLSTSGKSINDLWSLYDKIQTHVRSLEALDITGDAYGVILTPMVLHKLPENIRLEWARQDNEKESDLNGLLTFLHQEILRRERSQSYHGEQSSSQSRADYRIKINARPSTASALHSSGKGGTGNTKSVCNACRKAHATAKCYSWNNMEVRQRYSLCYEKGLCFLCLGRQECRSNNRCRCSGKHHPLLCSVQPSNLDYGGEGGSSEGSVQTSHPLRVQTNNFPLQEETIVKNTVLQTATVTAVRNDGGQTKINILFDSGSDRSYISTSCAKDLALNSVGKENISVSLFGQAKPNNPRLRNKYKLKLLDNDLDTEDMTVIETLMICAPLHRPKLPSEIVEKLRLENLSLNEGSLVEGDGRVFIDVLIGLDWFWKFMKPKCCRITEHLTAQDTRFGWILSGSWGNDTGSNDKGYPLNNQFLCMSDVLDDLCNKLWNLDVIGIEGTI